MAGLSDFGATSLLGHLTGKTSYTLPTTFLALFSVAPVDAGTGGTEVSGSGYARVATSGLWGTPTGSDPSTITNSSAITFPTSTGSWAAGASIVAWGLYDASTVGNLIFWDYNGNFSWIPFTGTSPNATPSILTAPTHGYTNGDSVVVASEFGGTLPGTGGSWAGIKTVAGVSGDTFNVGVNGNNTTTGSGLVRKVAGQIINASGVTYSYSIGNLIITLT